MNLRYQPGWIDKELLLIEDYDSIQDTYFELINNRLEGLKSDNPLISIIISAWNEEINIVRCLDSLSRTNTALPIEIIVVNNNSTDKTQKSLDRIKNIKVLFQPKQGCGPSRQLGQEKAAGKYILLADADCHYPPSWIDRMYDELIQDNVVCVYGRYSFLTAGRSDKIKLLFYNFFKNLMIDIRQYKRPFLNTYGISMGYIKELGLKVGFIDHNTWGDDGRLAFDLMKFGKIVPVKSKDAIVYTGYRSLLRDGGIGMAFFTRLVKEAFRFGQYFYKKEEHNTKTSKNTPHSIRENLEAVKNKLKQQNIDD